ncbi:hypothetical protein RDV78_07410 [Bacillota bacterium LX-D]|nr:hypothetical protein [Bacillota bacterium LX-D]
MTTVQNVNGPFFKNIKNINERSTAPVVQQQETCPQLPGTILVEIMDPSQQ